MADQKFRVWYSPQIPMPAFFYDTDSLDTARAVLDALGQFSAYEYNNGVKPDYADAGGIELWDEEYGWEEYDDYDE